MDSPATAAHVAQLEAEIAALRARVEELSAQRGSPSPAPEAEPRALLSELRPAVVQWDAEGVVTRWSEGAERFFGHSAAEAEGRHFLDLVMVALMPEETKRRVVAGILAGRVGPTEGVYATRTGQRSCRWTHTVQRDAEGRSIGVISEAMDIGDRDEIERALRESRQLLLGIVDNSPNLIVAKDRQGRYTLVNRRGEELYGKPLSALIGSTDDDHFPPDVVARMRASDEHTMATRMPTELEHKVPFPSGERVLFTVKFPILDPAGEPAGTCIIATDVTKRRQAEAEREELQAQVIAAQEAALRELSTPLVPIAAGVIAMPLVGAIDGVRADQIMSTLLEGIGRHGAHTAILDITGVKTVDTYVAGALLSAAQAARLLGTRVVLTGIRGDVARTLVDLDVGLGDIVTRGTLQAGIAWAVGRRTAAD
jgi:rsbT co-antagonist protein RsbR